MRQHCEIRGQQVSGPAGTNLLGMHVAFALCDSLAQIVTTALLAPKEMFMIEAEYEVVQCSLCTNSNVAIVLV